MADQRRAISVIGSALRSAPEDASAITADGMLAYVDERCRDAVRSFRRALTIDANDLQARRGLASCDRTLGDFSGMITESRVVLSLDPLSPQRAATEEMVGMGYVLTGHPGDAIEWLERAGASVTGQGDHSSEGAWK